MDVSRAKILGRPIQRRNETIIAQSRVQVCSERCVLRRGRQRSLPESHGKSWRDQIRNGDAGLRQSSARLESEVHHQEALTTNGPACSEATARHAQTFYAALDCDGTGCAICVSACVPANLPIRT